MLHRRRHLPSSGCRTGHSLLCWRLHPFRDVSFASPHDNTAGIARVSYVETLCHVLSVYPWLIFGDDVHGSALGVWYRHSAVIPVFSFDILSPFDTEHRRIV